uniref:Photosystem II reaction center protein Z n=1 Tax=Trachelomonas grandis TaxID=215769 RepID=A0A385UL09_9EUGL|nr:photosystem II Z protein [Trachelomonas grandis]
MLLFSFQLSLLALVILSSFLVVVVPVVFASPNGFKESKNYIVFGILSWLGLVFIVGGLNYFVI